MGCGVHLGLGVFVSIRVSPQASSRGPVLGVLADYVRSSPSASRGLCAAERIDFQEAEGGWEHTLHARTRTHEPAQTSHTDIGRIPDRDEVDGIAIFKNQPC